MRIHTTVIWIYMKQYSRTCVLSTIYLQWHPTRMIMVSPFLTPTILMERCPSSKTHILLVATLNPLRIKDYQEKIFLGTNPKTSFLLFQSVGCFLCGTRHEQWLFNLASFFAKRSFCLLGRREIGRIMQWIDRQKRDDFTIKCFSHWRGNFRHNANCNVFFLYSQTTRITNHGLFLIVSCSLNCECNLQRFTICKQEWEKLLWSYTLFSFLFLIN